MTKVTSSSPENSIVTQGALFDSLITEILERNPLHKQFLERSLAFLTQAERERVETILEYLAGLGRSTAYIAECYTTVVEDTFAEQMYFMRHGEYRNSSYAEVADSVYHDRQYMDKYMYGLIVTAFLWPNHIEIARFFSKHLPLDTPGKYLEIGPGHGYFMATAASRGAFNSLLGVDISEASIEQTRALLSKFAPNAADRCELRQCDFLDAETLGAGSFQTVVMGEVLEHVEQPDAFLRRIHELARDDAFIYVTTCINAPAVDHIFLWRSTDELEALIEACGFRIREVLRLPYEGKTLAEARELKLSINVAYVLKKDVAN